MLAVPGEEGEFRILCAHPDCTMSVRFDENALPIGEFMCLQHCAPELRAEDNCTRSVRADLRCDGRGCSSQLAFSVATTDHTRAVALSQEKAVEFGWRCDSDGDFCPSCEAVA